MTHHKYDFTENSAKHAVDSMLVGAETSAIIAENVAAGKSMDEVGEAVFDRMSQAEINHLAKDIRIVNLLLQMGKAFGMGEGIAQLELDLPTGRLENNAFLGYKAIANHFVDSRPAKRWQTFFNSAETIGDVYHFFLEETGLTLEDHVYPQMGYSILFVERLLKTRLDQKEVVEFAINQTAMDELIAKRE
jgi:hypothetical protein